MSPGEELKVGMMVMTGHGVGMVSAITDNRIQVQFGASGPFRAFKPNSVLPATPEEVKQSSLGGVGSIVTHGTEPARFTHEGVAIPRSWWKYDLNARLPAWLEGHTRLGQQDALFVTGVPGFVLPGDYLLLSESGQVFRLPGYIIEHARGPLVQLLHSGEV